MPEGSVRSARDTSSAGGMSGRFALRIFLVLLLGVAGCVGARSAIEQSRSSTYAYDIAPFPVAAPDGQALRFPFLGGLQVPRPQLIDIDADDDLDLFLQETSGRIMYFENTGTASDASYTWRSFNYRALEVGEWYRFTDLDDDGDADLLAEQPYNYIRVYRNVGTPGSAGFELVVDTLKDIEGNPIFSDRQNIPNVHDIDCDGLSDLFLGRLDGTITRYEAVSESPASAPRFRLVTESFEDIRIVGELGQPGLMPQVPGVRTPGPSAPAVSPKARRRTTKHGANTMTFVDIDGDGDPDLLWGDYFEPGLLLIENIGSCRSPDFAEPRPFPPADPIATSGYNAPTVGDLDGDGDVDVLIGVIGGAFNPRRTARKNFYYYENRGDNYVLRTRRYLDGIDVGAESNPAPGDLEGDGDVDLLVGNKVGTGDEDTAHLVRYENIGTKAQPAFVLADTLRVAPGYNYAPALGDLDADGDLDLSVGTWNKGVSFYSNRGDGSFELIDRLRLDLERGSHTTPTFGDFDADGDLDLVVGETDGMLNYFRNTGTPTAPAFVRVPEVLSEVDAGRRSAPTTMDVDRDGRPDLVVGSEDESLAVLRNTGSGFAATGSMVLPIVVPDLLAPSHADLDADGRTDILLGTGRGGLLYFEQDEPAGR